jgi:hypothetical protein
VLQESEHTIACPFLFNLQIDSDANAAGVQSWVRSVIRSSGSSLRSGQCFAVQSGIASRGRTAATTTTTGAGAAGSGGRRIETRVNRFAGTGADVGFDFHVSFLMSLWEKVKGS